MNLSEFNAWLNGYEHSFDQDDEGFKYPHAYQWALIRREIEKITPSPNSQSSPREDFRSNLYGGNHTSNCSQTSSATMVNKLFK